MENEPFGEPTDNNLDKTDGDMEPLLASLGVEVSPQMYEVISLLKDSLLDSSADPDTVRQLWIEYAQYFEALAEGTDDQESYIKIQIAAILHKAFIFRDTGRELRYLEELDKGDMYIGNAGFDTLSAVISTQIDVRTKHLEKSPERFILQLRGKIDDANRAFLWDLWAEEQDYEDLVNHAYEMLLNEDEDPEEVLGALGILEL